MGFKRIYFIPYRSMANSDLGKIVYSPSPFLVGLQYDTYSGLGFLVMSKLFLASVVCYPILHLERDAQVHS